MARGRRWGLVFGCLAGAAAAWGVVAGREWLRRRYRGREHLHRRAYDGYAELVGDLAAFWREPTRLQRLRQGLRSEPAFLARLMVVAVRAAQCGCLWSLAERVATNLGLDSDEIARLGAGDLAVAEVAQVQALLTAVRHGEEDGELDADVLSELRRAYGKETALLIVDWLDLVGMAARVGHTWELALARLGGAAKGSVLRPLATVGLAIVGGLPLLAWGILWGGSTLDAEPTSAEKLSTIPPTSAG